MFRVFCRRARWFLEFLWQSLSLCRAGSDVLLSLGQISRGPKDVFVDSKGNVKEFFGSGFGRFRLVSIERFCGVLLSLS